MKREQIIGNIRSLLASIMPGEASVFLFGSQARGDYSTDSDWDLLILLKQNGSIGISDRGAYTFPIYELGAELGVDINPVVYTHDDWNKRSFTPFYKNVMNERIRIWG